MGIMLYMNKAGILDPSCGGAVFTQATASVFLWVFIICHSITDLICVIKWQ